jgi:hypothetical protein
VLGGLAAEQAEKLGEHSGARFLGVGVRESGTRDRRLAAPDNCAKSIANR